MVYLFSETPMIRYNWKLQFSSGDNVTLTILDQVALRDLGCKCSHVVTKLIHKGVCSKYPYKGCATWTKANC